MFHYTLSLILDIVLNYYTMQSWIEQLPSVFMTEGGLLYFMSGRIGGGGGKVH